MAIDTWSSVTWEVESEGEASVWHKQRVPYTSNANALQNLDVWIPAVSDKAQDVPESSLLPVSKGLWVIYIHGGAWRDPLVTSSSFAPTVKELVTKHSTIFSHVAGIASINYSLSPRATDVAPFEPSNQAKHPDHIVDVLTGLSYLQSKAGFGNNYVLLGHSCGATLAFQVAMLRSKWGPSATDLQVSKPKVIVGLNGLYDMPALIRRPGDRHASLKPVYESFTRLAFSDDEKVWDTISPISVNDWSAEWPEGSEIVLVQSHEDTLVPYWQLDEMRTKLQESNIGGIKLRELDAAGNHNELWQKGDRLAEIIVDVVQTLI